MTSHTPGPWQAYESSERAPFPIGVPVEVGTVVGRGAKIGTICEMNGQGVDGKYSSEVTAANARLIAAAPDLLAALTILLRHSGYRQMTDAELELEHRLGNGFAPILLQARAAIAKATKPNGD